jgi:hypothetical protein
LASKGAEEAVELVIEGEEFQAELANCLIT